MEKFMYIFVVKMCPLVSDDNVREIEVENDLIKDECRNTMSISEN